MSLHNEIQVGRFNRFAQKLVGIKGPPPMPTLAGDMQFVHPIQSGSENRYLEGWDIFFRESLNAPLAGALATHELRNPINSNTIAVLEVCHIQANAVDTGGNVGTFLALQIGANADQGTSITPHAMDSRGRPGSSLIFSYNNASAVVAPGGTQFSYKSKLIPVANTNLDFLNWGEELVVVPGNAVIVQCGTVTNSMITMMRWRERLLEDSERA